MGALSAAESEPNKPIGSLSGICSASDVDPPEGRNSPTRFQRRSADSPMPRFCTNSRAIAVSMSSSPSNSLQTFGGKLAFHGESHEKLLAHQTQTDFLHRPAIGEELHFHRPLLANAP